MILDTDIAGKVDPELKRALRECSGGEILRTVMLVSGDGSSPEESGVPQESGSHEERPSIEPANFDSRMEYQRALRQRQTVRVASLVTPVRQQIEDLDLKTYGGGFSRSLVVEGPAEYILASLKLPGVEHASLDQPLSRLPEIPFGPPTE